MARGRKKSLTPIRGMAAVVGDTSRGQTNFKAARKSHKLSTRSRKNRKIGSARM